MIGLLFQSYLLTPEMNIRCQGIKPGFPLKVYGGFLGLSKYQESAVCVCVSLSSVATVKYFSAR